MLLEDAKPAPGVAAPVLAAPLPGARERPLRAVVRALVLGSVVLAALTLLAPSAPTYDPFAWIIWGREVLHLDLVTTSGPSWKPLPVMFTTVFAVFGGAAPALWLVVARAGAIAAVGLAYLTGRRLGAGPWGAGVAALTLATAHVWTFNAWLGNSEGLLVACLLGALLAHLHGHPRAALLLGLAAGLLRPEAWVFLGLYALWALWCRRLRLGFVVASLAVLPVLWLGPEWWGSGNLFRASTRARSDLPPGSPGASAHPGVALVHEFARVVPPGVWVALAATLVAAVVAARRRGNWRTLASVAVFAAAWVGLVAVMAGAGYSGNERYVIAPVALAIVLGGVGISAVLRLLPGAARPVVAVLAAAGLALPGVVSTAHYGHEMIAQSRLPGNLDAAVERAGGAARLRSCGPGGHIYTEALLVPQVAWSLGVHLDQLTYIPRPGTSLVIRGEVSPDAPITPPLGVYAGAPQRTLATAPRWRIIVTGRCAA